ncbi:MFS general substrate transporter [Cryphonectria parasitica EP155]|uniref:MFS general substrate transporter n=1 Tax=Cryphonectria parasitica (strain ATCC 38755 / EP155) TaxID=660469 RepID=A0A9P5CQU3_CRYP1|nr:MFS general substrate transporter [Cryphonectria parasitica EP155]KAF3767568.1 MFS general substrate transporter [Cryphonectria parasitica EP155]
MPDETTGLLGAGTRNHRYDAAAVGSEDPDTGASSRKDSWDGYKEYEHLPWHRRPTVYWLIPPYALFTLAFGGSIVPKLNLIIDLVCQRYFAEQTMHDGHFMVAPVVLGGDNPQCKSPEVQQHVAAFTLVLNVLVGSLSAYTAPKIGSLSDRYGRKKLLALASFGGVMAEIVTICAARFPDVIHYRWLLLGFAFDGLAGSFTAGSVLSHSYTSDCTPPSKRGVAIGYLHSCLFSGLAFGPLIAGYFVKWTGSLLSVFYVTLGCHIFFILCVSFVIPESVSRRRQLLARERHAADVEKRDRRTRDRWFWSIFATPKYANLIASIRSANPFEPLKVLAPRGPENARVRRNLVLLALTDMVILGAAMSSGQVTLLYSEYIFGWGNFETSRFISLVSMVRVFVLLAIFPVVNYLFRTRPAANRRRVSGPIVESNAGADDLDVWILRFAIFSDVIGLAGYIFARTEALFVLSGVVTAFGGLGSATIQSMLSKHMPAERTGAVLGAVGLLHALSRIISPVVFNGLYAATVKTFPQAVFVALTSLFLVILVLSTMVRPHGEPPPPPLLFSFSFTSPLSLQQDLG